MQRKPINNLVNSFVKLTDSASCFARKPGPSRATAGPGETFSRGPKHFREAPLRRNF